MDEFTKEEKKVSDNLRCTAIVSIVVAVAVVGICLALLIVGIVAVDPFGWNLVDQLLGGSTAVAKVMPLDTGINGGVDLSELGPDRLDRVVDPCLREVGAENVTTLARALTSWMPKCYQIWTRLIVSIAMVWALANRRAWTRVRPHRCGAIDKPHL